MINHMIYVQCKSDYSNFGFLDNPPFNVLCSLLDCDPVSLCKETGETWQYLGTITGNNGVKEHQFRHRYFQIKANEKRRVYVYIREDHGKFKATYR